MFRMYLTFMNSRMEIVRYLRNKLASSKAKTVFLTISLTEALVKNCGTRVHVAFGSDYNSSNSFMREMVRVARRYFGKSGLENVEVAELVLDVIQAWGEAFLVMSKQFPAFVGAYHELRKDGFKFKPQYDPNRVPIFTHDSSSGALDGRMTADDMLAASLNAQLNEHDESRDRQRSNSNVVTAPTTRANTAITSNSASGVYANLLSSAVTILCEIITAASSASEIKRNEVAFEVYRQVNELHGEISSAIEESLQHEPDVAERLFRLNDDAQVLKVAYEGLREGSTSLAMAVELVTSLSVMLASSIAPVLPTPSHSAAQPSLIDTDNDPFNPPAAPAPATATARAAASSSSAHPHPHAHKLAPPPGSKTHPSHSQPQAQAHPQAHNSGAPAGEDLLGDWDATSVVTTTTRATDQSALDLLAMPPVQPHTGASPGAKPKVDLDALYSGAGVRMSLPAAIAPTNFIYASAGAVGQSVMGMVGMGMGASNQQYPQYPQGPQGYSQGQGVNNQVGMGYTQSVAAGGVPAMQNPQYQQQLQQQQQQQQLQQQQQQLQLQQQQLQQQQQLRYQQQQQQQGPLLGTVNQLRPESAFYLNPPLGTPSHITPYPPHPSTTQAHMPAIQPPQPSQQSLSPSQPPIALSQQIANRAAQQQQTDGNPFDFFS